MVIVLRVIAAVLLVMEAVGVSHPRINLGMLGLAIFVVSTLL